MIAELSAKWPVAALCREMSVNRSGFYKWVKRQSSPSERDRKRIDAIALFVEYHAKYPSHGYRWLNAKVRLDLGIAYTDEFARRCCRYMGIKSQSKHYRYKAPGEPRKSYPNLVLTSLRLTDPLQCVVSDMTAFWASGKYWELTLYMDLWNDEIIAYGLSSRKGDPSTYFARFIFTETSDLKNPISDKVLARSIGFDNRANKVLGHVLKVGFELHGFSLGG